MAKVGLELKPRLLLGGVRAMGPGKADLLELIDETGSISAAAKRMQMSYRRAWVLVDQMNASFKEPLVEASMGGRGGGGARITEAGRDVLAHYRRLQADLEAVAAPYLAGFQKRLKKFTPV